MLCGCHASNIAAPEHANAASCLLKAKTAILAFTGDHGKRVTLYIFAGQWRSVSGHCTIQALIVLRVIGSLLQDTMFNCLECAWTASSATDHRQQYLVDACRPVEKRERSLQVLLGERIRCRVCCSSVLFACGSQL